jgi:hypothetical protein
MLLDVRVRVGSCRRGSAQARCLITPLPAENGANREGALAKWDAVLARDRLSFVEDRLVTLQLLQSRAQKRGQRSRRAGARLMRPMLDKRLIEFGLPILEHF